MADAYLTRVGSPFTLGIPSITNFTLDASTDAVEFVFHAEDAATLTRLGFRQGTVTGTGPTFRVSLQGVDASGLPDGTIKSSGNAYADITPVAGGDSTWQWVTLGATYACSRGERLAMVIKYQSGTINGSNSCSFGLSGGLGTGGFPKAILNNVGSRNVSSGTALFAYGSSSRAWGRPIETSTTISVGPATTPDEIGWYIAFPSGWGSTYKIACAKVAISTASHTYQATLYDTDGTTVLQQVDVNGNDVRGGAGIGTEFWFDESTLSDLAFGSVYRLTVTRLSTSNAAFYYVEADANADLQAWPMGEYLSWTERTDAGAWTDRGNRRLIGELILADITEPSGGSGGGLILPRSMSGGLV